MPVWQLVLLEIANINRVGLYWLHHKSTRPSNKVQNVLDEFRLTLNQKPPTSTHRQTRSSA